jgi:tetratricopeptide (TPR) repeat protein
MQRLPLVLLTIACLFSSPRAFAHVTVDGDSLATSAGAAYDSKDWAKAADLYGKLSQSTDAPPRVWLRLGASLRHLDKYDDALAAFEHASQAGAGPFADFGKAIVYAAMKQIDKALVSLEKAVEQGYAQPDTLASEPDFVALRNDPRFAKLVEQAKKNQRPCAYAPENRQFDFWLGEWSVATTQGAVPSGDSKIELILEDCVVQENWKSLNGPYSGKSYNIYNQSLKRWEQYWVDNVGGNIFFYGGLKDGVMDYWTDDVPQSDGTHLKRHLQFIPLGPGKVRQFSQGSTDGGKTWHVEYDFTYSRKK